jgi:hypothetical protein
MPESKAEKEIGIETRQKQRAGNADQERQTNRFYLHDEQMQDLIDDTRITSDRL